MYLTLQFNGETFKKRPKDLREAILSVKPDVLHTEMYVTLKRGSDIREKRLNLREGRSRRKKYCNLNKRTLHLNYVSNSTI